MGAPSVSFTHYSSFIRVCQDLVSKKITVGHGTSSSECWQGLDSGCRFMGPQRSQDCALPEGRRQGAPAAAFGPAAAAGPAPVLPVVGGAGTVRRAGFRDRPGPVGVAPVVAGGEGQGHKGREGREGEQDQMSHGASYWE